MTYSRTSNQTSGSSGSRVSASSTASRVSGALSRSASSSGPACGLPMPLGVETLLTRPSSGPHSNPNPKTCKDPEEGVGMSELAPAAESTAGRARQPSPGIALCLSGGGYRAMLFHVGALWRLNEAGYLPKLERVSSVSGGSITAGALGLAWPKLAFDGTGVAEGFQAELVEPLRRMAGKTIDFPAIAVGLLLPGVTIGERVAGAYRKHLFGASTLQDLPDYPRFVFNATNLQSGVLWRFAKPYMRDYRVGEVKKPTVDLATAVAASSAFPPLLSPVVLDLDESAYTPESGVQQRVQLTKKTVITGGGFYDDV